MCTSASHLYSSTQHILQWSRYVRPSHIICYEKLVQIINHLLFFSFKGQNVMLNIWKFFHLSGIKYTVTWMCKHEVGSFREYLLNSHIHSGCRGSERSSTLPLDFSAETTGVRVSSWAAVVSLISHGGVSVPGACTSAPRSASLTVPPWQQPQARLTDGPLKQQPHRGQTDVSNYFGHRLKTSCISQPWFMLLWLTACDWIGVVVTQLAHSWEGQRESRRGCIQAAAYKVL